MTVRIDETPSARVAPPTLRAKAIAVFAVAQVAYMLWSALARLTPIALEPWQQGMLGGFGMAVALAWAAFNGLLLMMQRAAPPLPAFELGTLDGSPTTLAAHAGRPVVLNMWATWCPPCRREMPVLEDAQAKYPGVAFVLVNQGEDRGTIRDYLDAAGLELDHVLLDPHSRAMLDTGTRGLPTTLFFNAQGRLVDTHMGELTRASLADTLRRRFGESAPPRDSAGPQHPASG